MDAPLGVVAVLSEALCLARRNKRQILPCLLLALIPSSLLLAGGHVSVYSLLLGFIARLHILDKENPVTPRFFDLLLHLKIDAEALSHVNVALVVTSHLGYFASTVIIVHASSAACAGRHLPVKDLLLKLAESWRKGPLETYLCSTLLSVGYTTLSVSLIAVPALNMAAAGGASPRLVVIVAASVAAAARFLYIYLAMVWTVGVVLSVVEDGCRGLEAMHRAGEAVRGRRAQGFLIAVVLAITNAAVGFGGSAGRSSRGWRDVFARAVHLLVGIFSPMVYTVFYHECKRSHSHGDGAPKELPRRTKVDHDHQGTSIGGAV